MFAILSNAHRLLIHDPGSFADPRQDFLGFMLSIGTSDDAHWHSSGLGAGVAEHLLGPRIPVGDFSVQIGRDDGIFGAFHDSREAPEIFLLALPFGGLAFQGTDGPSPFL